MTEELAIYAPAGWGYAPGARIDRPTAADLPEIPGLDSLGVRARNVAIINAIRSRTGLAAQIKAADIFKRYEITYRQAWEIHQLCL